MYLNYYHRVTLNFRVVRQWRVAVNVTQILDIFREGRLATPTTFRIMDLSSSLSGKERGRNYSGWQFIRDQPLSLEAILCDWSPVIETSLRRPTMSELSVTSLTCNSLNFINIPQIVNLSLCSHLTAWSHKRNGYKVCRWSRTWSPSAAANLSSRKQPSGTHWIERFMRPVSVWGGSKMKEKPPRPLAFEPLTVQAESL